MKKQKYIRVTMPDNSVWDVPARVVAGHRAKYYSNLDHPTNKTLQKKTFKEEVKFSLENDDELLDWAKNNMDWFDVKKYAEKISEEVIDYQDGWINGDSEVVEK